MSSMFSFLKSPSKSEVKSAHDSSSKNTQLKGFSSTKDSVINEDGDGRSDDGEDDDDDKSVSQAGSSAINEDEEFIRNGNKGIIVFTNIYCVKTCRYKTFHLHLNSGSLIQYSGQSRKRFQCGDIQDIHKNHINQVIVKMKHSMDISSKKKKYCFDSDEAYLNFKKYIEFMNETGSCIRKAFDEIDANGMKTIKRNELQAAMTRYDIETTDIEISKMLSLRNKNSETYQYHDFFHLFMDFDVASVRDCLLAWLHLAKTNADTDSNKISNGIQMNYLPGEELKHTIDKARWCTYSGNKTKEVVMSSGRVFITNYRISLISFLPNRNSRHSHFDIPPFFDRLTIPLSNIYKIQGGEKKSFGVQTKDNRFVRIQLVFFSEDLKAEVLATKIQKLAHMEKHDNIKDFAFAYRFKVAFNLNGWVFNEIRKEYARQGLDDQSNWKMVDNSDFALIETYPRWLIVPAKLAYETLTKSIHHRAKNRFPAITYRHTNGALVSRSAQPISGIMNACNEDEILLNFYRTKGNPDNSKEKNAKYYIYDARRQIAATLNRAGGKGGTENAAAYVNTELIYCNIDNIHVMRTSFEALGDLLSPGATIDIVHGEAVGGVGFYQKLEETGWLRYVRLILIACVRMAERVHLESSSVLCHCSDGWDRTAQLCSLTQIILDPFFRTLEGIATLIEKEWCCFGFKFNDRCGHAQDASHKPDERSPVFVQFLDCLFQIMRQFPNSFEYTEQLLVFLGDHEHSCLFGTFLGNFEKMRRDLSVKDETMSIWSFVFEFKEEFLNPNFVAFAHPIWPNCSMASIKLWERFYLRWDPESHPSSLTNAEWHDNWGSGLETFVPRNIALYQINETYRKPLSTSRKERLQPEKHESTGGIPSPRPRVQKSNSDADADQQGGGTNRGSEAYSKPNPLTTPKIVRDPPAPPSSNGRSPAPVPISVEPSPSLKVQTSVLGESISLGHSGVSQYNNAPIPVVTAVRRKSKSQLQHYS